MLREFSDSTEIHSIESFAIVVDIDLLHIEDFCEFLEESPSIRFGLFSTQHRSLGIFITRITDLSGRISDQEDDLTAHILELSQLQKWDHMSEMDDRP